MGRTTLAACAPCQVLVHVERAGTCPECSRALAAGLAEVGFHDARRVYGEPGNAWVAPSETPRCADGHKARSRDEAIIDDWLHARGIPHEREPKLKGMRPDWRVGETYIEYWGMAGQRGYEERRSEKLALYKKRRLKLIELFPEDIERLDEKLGGLAGATRVWF